MLNSDKLVQQKGQETTPLLPTSSLGVSPSPSQPDRIPFYRSVAAVVLLYSCALVVIGHSYLYSHTPTSLYNLGTFHTGIKTHGDLCPDEGTSGVRQSHSGYIGLSGDSEVSPRRSFFW